MININIQTIPNSEQAYPTVGNYWEENGELQFRVSDMKNHDYEFLVVIHELIEQHLVKKRGISLKDIDTFDINFEKERDEGKHDIMEEAGDSKDAPYYKEHQYATGIERVLANELGIDWNEYNKTVMELY